MRKPFRSAAFIGGTTLVATPSVIAGYGAAAPTTFIFLALHQLYAHGLEGFGAVGRFVQAEWTWHVPAFAITAAVATLIAVLTYRERKPKQDAPVAP